MKYLLSLILLIGFFVPCFAVTEEVVEAEEELYPMDYHSEESGWIYLDDMSYKKSGKMKYFDKAGLPVNGLSLQVGDKVLAEIEYPEDASLPGEVLSLQLYKATAAGGKTSVAGENAVEQGAAQLLKKEDKPLYKENGVWKN